MSRRAMLIGTASYRADRELGDLPAVPHDIDRMADTLQRRGGFDTVHPHVDLTHDEIIRRLEEFYAAGRTGDLLLLYFSGHGITDADRTTLFLGGTNTEQNHLHSTAVNSHAVIRKLLDETRASQKVVLLDCCFSGAFGDQFHLRGGLRANVQQSLQHRGTFVLTASDRLQVAREPAKSPGECSLFTGVLLEGLEGRARDGDNDGWLTAQDLAGYVQEQLPDRVRGQTPSVFNDGVTGPIRIALVDELPDVGARPATRQPYGSAGRGADAEAPFDTAQWRRLLTYYIGCLERDNILGSFVDLRDRDRYTVYPGGRETLSRRVHQ